MVDERVLELDCVGVSVLVIRIVDIGVPSVAERVTTEVITEGAREVVEVDEVVTGGREVVLLLVVTGGGVDVVEEVVGGSGVVEEVVMTTGVELLVDSVVIGADGVTGLAGSDGVGVVGVVGVARSGVLVVFDILINCPKLLGRLDMVVLVMNGARNGME